MVTVEDAGEEIEKIIVDESEEDEVLFIPPIVQIEKSIFTKTKEGNDKCVPTQPQKVQSVPINPQVSTQPNEIQSVPINPQGSTQPGPIQSVPINPPSSTQPGPVQSVPIQPSTSKPFECHICHKKYVRKQTLKCHILSHDKSKWAFKCDKEGCSAIFYMKSSLKDHKKIHTGERNEICFNEGCGKSYANHQTRNRHSKFHCKLLKK